MTYEILNDVEQLTKLIDGARVGVSLAHLQDEDDHRNLDFHSATYISDELLGFITESIKPFKKKCFEWHVLDYANDAHLNEKQCFFIPKDHDSDIYSVFSSVTKEHENTTITSFYDVLKEATYLIFTFGDDSEENIALFYSITRKKQVKKPILDIRGEVADIKKQNSVFLPNLYDWLFIILEDGVLVSPKGYKELLRKTGLNAHIIEKATEVIDVIGSLDLISGFDEFQSACKKNFNILNKFSRITDTAIIEELDIDKINTLNDDFELKLEIEDEMIVYDYKSIWNIIRIFNDDCLKSVISDKKYLAAEKSIV